MKNAKQIKNMQLELKRLETLIYDLVNFNQELSQQRTPLALDKKEAQEVNSQVRQVIQIVQNQAYSVEAYIDDLQNEQGE